MTVFHFRALFFLVFILSLGLELLLIILNRRESKLSKSSENAKSCDYTLSRMNFEMFSLIFSSAFTLILLFSGLLPWLSLKLLNHLGASPSESVLFLGLIFSAQFLLNLPLGFYSTFYLEAKFGFNTMTLGTYLRDLIKSMLLSALLGIPFLYLTIYSIQLTGHAWWYSLLALILLVQIMMLIVYPFFIAPLFNRFKPMENGILKDHLLTLASRLRFPTSDIFVMDGSRRSLHANAYFTGFGKWRRIVLFDTLVDQMESDELQSILAHEIGHNYHKHLYKRFFMQILFLGATLFLASRIISSSTLFSVFGFSSLTSVPENISQQILGLFLFFTAASSLGIFISPLFNFFSRKHEFEADAYAKKAMGGFAAMKSALIKLTEKNLSNLNPHPWYQFFHYSHPTTAERIQGLETR